MVARVLKAGFAYCAIVFGAGFAFGMLRVPFLVPLLGVRVAEFVEMPLMFVVILLAAQFVVARFALESAAQRAGCGLVGLALIVAAELALVAAQGQRVIDYIATRDPVSGTVYLVMLGVFAAMPAISEQLKPPPTPSA